MYVIVEDGIVKSVQLDKELIPIAIEAPDDILFGDLYDGVTFTKLPREVIPQPTPSNDLTLKQLEDSVLYLLGVSNESRP